MAINLGWGQRHSLDGTAITRLLFGWTFPKEYILLYTPRNDDELRVVMNIVRASVSYMTNSEISTSSSV